MLTGKARVFSFYEFSKNDAEDARPNNVLNHWSVGCVFPLIALTSASLVIKIALKLNEIKEEG